MMGLYFVKRNLWGIDAGRVERFSKYRASQLLMSGDIEPYDEKKHAEAPGAPPRTAPPGPSKRSEV